MPSISMGLLHILAFFNIKSKGVAKNQQISSCGLKSKQTVQFKEKVVIKFYLKMVIIGSLVSYRSMPSRPKHVQMDKKFMFFSDVFHFTMIALLTRFL